MISYHTPVSQVLPQSHHMHQRLLFLVLGEALGNGTLPLFERPPI